jgi:hypothetical protein
MDAGSGGREAVVVAVVVVGVVVVGVVGPTVPDVDVGDVADAAAVVLGWLAVGEEDSSPAPVQAPTASTVVSEVATHALLPTPRVSLFGPHRPRADLF